MEVVRPHDAAAFLQLAGPLLTSSEGRHNLMLGIAGTASDHPEAYDEIRLWVVLDAGVAVAAALRTPPHNLVLADPVSGDALDAVLRAVLDDEDELPGVVGNEPVVEGAAAALAQGLGRSAELTLRQGLFELTDVRPVQRPSGAARAATPADRELVRAWNEAFLLEAVPEPEAHLAWLDRTVDARLEGTAGGIWLWEDGAAPVCLSGFGGRTPTGIRVGPVYTPPDLRGRGYATALVADLSGWLLERGHRACFLYTDLSNPTSNAIYERIGYRRVTDAREYRFR